MRGRFAAIAAVTMLCVGVAACGSSDSSDDSTNGGGASTGAKRSKGTIEASLLLDMTGFAGGAGSTQIKQGVDFAVKQANESGELDGTTIKVNLLDNRSTAQTAAANASKATASKSVAAIYGVLSQGALAGASVAQRGKLPFIAMESGDRGIPETGDYIFRSTAPQERTASCLSDYWKEKGYKRVALVFDQTFPAAVTMVNEVYPELAKAGGYELASKTPFNGRTDPDFKAIVGKALQSKPDVVQLQVGPASVPGLVTGLRRAGYKGAIAGNDALDVPGLLKSLGPAANGVIYNIDFNAGSEDPATKKFDEAYKTASSGPPTRNVAMGYDAVRFLVAGIKATDGEITRESLQKGLTKAAGQGFEGASGQVTFEGRDARQPGLTVEQRDGETTIVRDCRPGATG